MPSRYDLLIHTRAEGTEGRDIAVILVGTPLGCRVTTTHKREEVKGGRKGGNPFYYFPNSLSHDAGISI